MGGEGPTPFDVQKLTKSPLLQSIFTETLRLRVHIYNSRCTGNEDFQINNWFIPKKSVVFVSSTPAHMEATEWNTGRNNKHPLDSFWADRFVVYPNDPFSGPNKRRSDSKIPTNQGPHFQLDGSMAGRFIPFGGGAYTCPGRHFAKREVLLTCAMLVNSLDVEILASDDAAKMDWRTCGFGTLKPAGKIAYRVRRRNASPTTLW
jgi:cytochrome P450